MTERSIFLEAAEILDPAERAAFLDRACSGNEALRQSVEDLLAAHARSGSFLRHPARLDPNSTAAHEPLSECPGTRVGPYKLLQEIGEGGMGTVFMAEQEEPVRRKVALKVIKAGMDTRQVVARFEAERQALSMMDHPNIAKVLDAGTTTSGRPFFVMELVHGVPITEYCDANKLTPQERLTLFVPICQAIQHAHMKGIIHRDIKPSNVLVTMYDDKPVPKVIDFGVARAVEQRLTERTLFTQYGALVGTFEYMSPEQAEMNAFGVDTRSDVYSLGVLLYELLTGSTPLERVRLRTAALGEVVRLIKEEEPPRPSQRLSTSGTLEKVAAARKTDPGSLSKLVRGELDWIVMRCLEKDRTRRYESATGLAKDLERYLTGDAVEACPPTLGYRVRKAYRRNRAAVLVGSAFTMLVIVAAAMGFWLAARATLSERVANEQRLFAESARVEAVQQRDLSQSARDRLRRSLYAADMQGANAAWESFDAHQVLDLLDRQRPAPGESDLRGFEWHYLNRENHVGQRSLDLPAGIKQFTPDGKRIRVSLQRDRRNDGKSVSSVREWDLKTGRELPEITMSADDEKAGGIIKGFSEDGKRMIVSGRIRGRDAGETNWFKVIDVASGRALVAQSTPSEKPLLMHNIYLDTQGRRVIELRRSLPDDKVQVYSLWDVDQGRLLQTVKLDTAEFENFSFSQSLHPNGKRFAAMVHKIKGGRPLPDSYELRIWNLDTGKEVSRVPMEKSPGAGALQYSPTGQYLARAAFLSGVVELRDPESGHLMHELVTPATGTGDKPNSLTFSPDGTWLAADPFGQRSVSVWNIDARRLAIDRSPVRVIAVDSDSPSFAFSHDNKSISFASFNASAVTTYDLSPRGVIVSGPEGVRNSPPYQIFCDCNATRFGAVWHQTSGDRTNFVLKIWDATGRVLWSRTQEFRPPSFDSGWFNHRLSGDGSHLFRCETYKHPTDPTRDHSCVRVWNATTGVELFHSERTELGEFAVDDIHPDGKRLVIMRKTRNQKTIPFDVKTRFAIWNIVTDSEESGFDIPGRVPFATVNADGSRVVTSELQFRPNSQAIVRVCETATGKEIWQRSEWGRGPGNFTLGSPVFSPDGRRIAVSLDRLSGGCDVYILDAGTGEAVRPPLHCRAGRILEIQMSADRERLFALTEINSKDPAAQRRAIIWDLITGRELLNLPANGCMLFAIEADGRRLRWMRQVPNSADVEIVTWDGTPLPEPKK